MKPGRPWVKWDVYFFDNTFTKALIDRFGLAGPAVFLAFVLACKQFHIPGRIRYRTDDQALEMMGIGSASLIDNEGEHWTLDEFWEVCGRHHQTRRGRPSVGYTTVVCRTFDEWQTSVKREQDAERKRRSRARNDRDGHALEIENEKESDTSKSLAHASVAAEAGSKTEIDHKPNPLAERLARATGKSLEAANHVIGDLRRRGVSDMIIDEAIGYASGDHPDGHPKNTNLAYIAKVAEDWYHQRTGTWDT